MTLVSAPVPSAAETLRPTCALGFVAPVATVVLPVALPPRRDAASVLALVLEIPGAAWHLGGSGCGKHSQWPSQTSLTPQRSDSHRHLLLVQCLFPLEGWGKILLTTVGLVRVVPAVVHAVALPLQAHAHSVGTLEGVGVAHFAEFRRRGCGRWEKKQIQNREVFNELAF